MEMEREGGGGGGGMRGWAGFEGGRMEGNESVAVPCLLSLLHIRYFGSPKKQQGQQSNKVMEPNLI